MNSSTEILFSIGQIISVLASLVVLVASIIIFTKTKTLATWLILIGNVLTIITYIGGIFINFFVGRNSIDTLLNAQAMTSIVHNLSYLVFAIGLIMLAITEFSKNKS